MPAVTKAQREKKRRDSRGPLEIRRDLDRWNVRDHVRRSQLSQNMLQPLSTAAVSSSSSSSSAVHNENRINDSDEDSNFSEDSLEPSPTQSPVKKRPAIPRKQPP